MVESHVLKLNSGDALGEIPDGIPFPRERFRFKRKGVGSGTAVQHIVPFTGRSGLPCRYVRPSEPVGRSDFLEAVLRGCGSMDRAGSRIKRTSAPRPYDSGLTIPAGQIMVPRLNPAIGAS